MSDAVLGLVEAGGKRARPVLAWLCAETSGGRMEAADPVALAAELIHAATLLHDDVLDDAEVRRGRPAARILWGNRVSVMAGDFLMTEALEAVCALGSARALRSFSLCLRQIIEGELLQQQLRFRHDVDEARYDRIVEGKTGSLFAWSAEAGAQAVAAREEWVGALRRFGLRLGIAFQILDDWLDWTGDPQVLGKAVRKDLREGNPSLAVVYGCQASPGVRGWLARHVGPDLPPPSDESLAFLAEELRDCGAIEGVRLRLRRETERALEELGRLPATAARDEIGTLVSVLLSEPFGANA